MLISFAAFQILIGWLIYCLAGFKQLAPNIFIFHLFVFCASLSLLIAKLAGFRVSKHKVCASSSLSEAAKLASSTWSAVYLVKLLKM